MSALKTHLTLQLEKDLNAFIEEQARKYCRSKRMQVLFILQQHKNSLEVKDKQEVEVIK